MKLIASGSTHIGKKWRAMQNILNEGVCNSKGLTIEIDIDADTKDLGIRVDRYNEIYELLTAARDGKSKHPQTTLLHWAARGGHPYVIGELLKDPLCDVLALDSADNTALVWALEAGKKEAAKILKDFMEKKIKSSSLMGVALIATLRFSEKNTLHYRGNPVRETPENNLVVIPQPQPPKPPEPESCSVKTFFSDLILCTRKIFRESLLKTNDAATLVQSVLLPVEIANQYGAVSRMFGKKREPAEVVAVASSNKIRCKM